MVKDLLVVLDDVGERAGPYAVSLAKAFGAHATAVIAAPESTFEAMAMAEARYDIVVAAREEAEDLAAKANHRFLDQAGDAGVTAEGLSACGLDFAVEEQVIGLARRHDLTVIEQWDSQRPKPADRLLEKLLLRTGRPTLIVPFIHDRPAAFNHVTVAWDGSGTAARAVADAIPLLQRANSVEIVSIETRAASDEVPRDDRIVTHLARHGIDARTRSIPTTLPVADALLGHVSDSGSDLLVMGAYGRSRLTEALLGGASRGILRSMTVPVLMSH